MFESISELLESYAQKGIAVIILAIVLSLVIMVGLFFLFRAITCWYLKINKLLAELRKTNRYLEQIAAATTQNPHMTVPVIAPSVAPAPVQAESAVPCATSERKCASCGATVKEGTLFCIQCGTKIEPEA